MTLGDHGAAVVKVESRAGEETRRYSPLFVDGESTSYLNLMNRNRRGIVVDLATAEGEEVTRRLAQTSHLLVEHFKTGTMVAGAGLRAAADAELAVGVRIDLGLRSGGAVRAGSGVRRGAPGVRRLHERERAAVRRGVYRRKQVRTNRRNDLGHRQFSAEVPARLWTAGITYLPTWQGFQYLAVVIDALSCRVVGWSMTAHMRRELVLDTLEMALWHRKPAAGLVHHTDRGSQYTSLAFGRRCREAVTARSMGSVGDCFAHASEWR